MLHCLLDDPLPLLASFFPGLEEQPGDADVRWFSFDPAVHVPRPQLSCYLTHTTAETHRILRVSDDVQCVNLHRYVLQCHLHSWLLWQGVEGMCSDNEAHRISADVWQLPLPCIRDGVPSCHARPSHGTGGECLPVTHCSALLNCRALLTCASNPLDLTLLQDNLHETPVYGGCAPEQPQGCSLCRAVQSRACDSQLCSCRHPCLLRACLLAHPSAAGRPPMS